MGIFYCMWTSLNNIDFKLKKQWNFAPVHLQLHIRSVLFIESFLGDKHSGKFYEYKGP